MPDVTRYDNHFALQGRTFEDLYRDNQPLRIDCKVCERKVAWPVNTMIVRGYRGYIYKVAEGFVCSACGGRDIFITLYRHSVGPLPSK